MVQEGAVESPPDWLIASEGEGNVGNPAADFATRAFPLDLRCGIDNVYSVVVVLRHASAHCQDVGVKDDVLRVKAHLLHQDLEGTPTYPDFVLKTSSLQIQQSMGCSHALCRQSEHIQALDVTA